jgi:hypothetical protein
MYVRSWSDAKIRREEHTSQRELYGLWGFPTGGNEQEARDLRPPVGDDDNKKRTSLLPTTPPTTPSSKRLALPRDEQASLVARPLVLLFYTSFVST